MPLKAHDAKQSVDPPFQFRAMLELLHHPYYHQAQGNFGAVNRFWDKTGWENSLRKDREEGYNVIIWFVDPWLRHLWPDFMIRNQSYPEARELTDQQADDIIAQLNWVFGKAHELGLQNIIFNHCVFFLAVRGCPRFGLTARRDADSGAVRQRAQLGCPE